MQVEEILNRINKVINKRRNQAKSDDIGGIESAMLSCRADELAQLKEWIKKGIEDEEREKRLAKQS